MASGFSEDEKIAICEICVIDKIALGHRLEWFDLQITTEVENKVRSLIDRWNAGVGTDFVRVDPQATNKGVSIDPNREKNDIRRTIGTLLWITDLMGAGGAVKIYRG
jgi:hypothetical protein